MASPVITERQVKGGKRNRNAFVRTLVSPAERVIGIVIVFLIAGIAGAIWYKGRHFDPNLYSLRTDALRSTVNAVQGKNGTLRVETGAQPGEEAVANAQPSANHAPAQALPSSGESTQPPASSGEGAEGGGTTAASPAASESVVKNESMEIPLPGIKPMGKTEFYSPDTLYEKIDGRAPAYLGFNFQQLRSRSFSIDGADASFVDVYEYRMDTPVNAFGMFALERDPAGKPIDFAPDGYSGEMGYFFRQGAFYVQIIASDQNPKTLAAAKALAVDRAKSIPVNNTGLDARRRLPSAGLIPESVTFVQDNAQGQQFLKNVFQGAYQFEGAKLSFFLMVAPPPETADAWKSYLAFSGKFGGKASELPEVKGAKIFQAENFGKCKVIYQRAGELGGVTDAQDAEKARKFVEEYLQGHIQ
jgi:hypothetical protein